MRLYANATIPPAVQLLSCDGATSTCLTMSPGEAECLAADLQVAALEARRMLYRATTRKMCSRCLRDCSSCICSSAGKGGAA